MLLNLKSLCKDKALILLRNFKINYIKFDKNMFGALLGAAIGAAGSIAGSIAKNKSLKNLKDSLERRKRENENWYTRRYNEDATQRADAQRMISMTEEAIKRRNRAAAGRAAVMGGTEESVAAEKEANNVAQANIIGQIAAEGERRKDAIEQQYLNRKERLEDKISEVDAQQQSGLDIFGNTLAGAGNGWNLGSRIEDIIGKNKSKE